MKKIILLLVLFLMSCQNYDPIPRIDQYIYYKNLRTKLFYKGRYCFESEIIMSSNLEHDIDYQYNRAMKFYSNYVLPKGTN